MAWYVEHLLKNKLSIESTGDVESGIFNDLLVIENTIELLEGSGILSSSDLVILGALSKGSTITESSSMADISRPTYAKRIRIITDKIAKEAGYEYTDCGFISRIEKNYRLTDEQVATMRGYITSKFKHKIMRKRYNAKKTIQ